MISWFEETLVAPLEKVRTRGDIRPKCPAMTRIALLNYNLDVDAVYSLFMEDQAERDLVFEKKMKFREPKKEYDLIICDDNELCATCYCPDDQLYSTGYCKHYICMDCFPNHYKAEVEKNQNAIKCFGEDCLLAYSDELLSMMTESLDKKLSSIQSAKRTAIIEAAKKSKYNWFLLPCTQTINCPNYLKISKKILLKNQLQSVTIYCKCGASYCTKHLLKENSLYSGPACDEAEGHEPLSCWHVKFYDAYIPKEEIRKRKVKDSDENRKFMQDHTRPCPRCKTRVWRDGGCKHLKCTCGAHFWRG